MAELDILGCEGIIIVKLDALTEKKIYLFSVRRYFPGSGKTRYEFTVWSNLSVIFSAMGADAPSILLLFRSSVSGSVGMAIISFLVIIPGPGAAAFVSTDIIVTNKKTRRSIPLINPAVVLIFISVPPEFFSIRFT
jgi:hypothetical protein